MGRNSICVIYDSDENYAKRLMSVINDDNDIPYNAQVFTQEQELDKYLQEKKADMLMICEGHMSMMRREQGIRQLCCVRKNRMPMKSILKRREGW